MIKLESFISGFFSSHRMAAGFLARNPREISFFYQGEELSTQEVFDQLYSYLNSTISTNYSARFEKKKNKTQKQKAPAPYIKRPDTGIDALVTFDDTSKMQCQVMPRTNFDYKGVLKKPNMAYLRSKNAIAILREAREYPLDMIHSVFFSEYHNKYDKQATEQIYDKTVAKGDVTPSDFAGRISIPEPQLTLTLDELHQKKAIKQMLPDFSVIDSTEDRLWYMRDFLPLAMDVSFDTELFGEFFGTLHALGLSERIDRQAIHYCHIDHGIGTYDPDFMSYSKSQRATVQNDWQDIKYVFEKDNFPLPNDSEIYFKEMKRVMNRTTHTLNQEGVTPHYFIKALDPEITIPDYMKRTDPSKTSQ